MMDVLKRYEGTNKSQNILRGMIFEKYTSISYETQKKAIIKIMTTLLTHNAVVSILMENSK